MIDIEKYGYNDSLLFEENMDSSMLGDLIPARVLAVYKERYEIASEHGVTYAKLKSAVYFNESNELTEEFPTTGDFVLINYNDTGDSQIVHTIKRKTFFSRKDPTPGRGEQAVASNFDYVFIVQSLNYDFNVKRLERYLTLAWQSGAVPVIVLTKSDLCENKEDKIREAEMAAIGTAVFAVSAKTGEGIEELEEYMKPKKTIVLLGSSGVGKSSLVNCLAGEDIMAVNTIREDDSKGRHTTTHRQLIMLPSGTMIIDTPGMRELGMWDVSTGLSGAFEDVEEYFLRCKFTDCKHESEPGCAVIEALENGELSRERWDNYNKLKKEAKFTDSRGEYIKEKTELYKRISKAQRNIKKYGKKQ